MLEFFSWQTKHNNAERKGLRYHNRYRVDYTKFPWITLLKLVGNPFHCDVLGDVGGGCDREGVERGRNY